MSNLIFPATPGQIRVRRTLVTKTEVEGADDAKEFRVGKYPLSRYRYEVRWGFLRQAAAYQEAQRIWRHFLMHGGRRESFLFQDPDDYTVTAHGFGVGDGTKTKFPLQRSPGGQWQDILGTWPTYTTPRTNLCLRSQEFDNASWSKFTGVTATANQAIAPDGTLTADKIVYDGSGSAGAARLSQGISVAPNGQSRVSSLWVRADAPVTLRLDANLAGGAGMQTMSITTAWQRFSAWGIGNGTDTSQVTIYSPGGVNTSFTVYAWGAQHETGSSPTRYIATTTAAVRADPSYWTADQTTGALVQPGAPDGFEPVTEPDWASVTLYYDGVAATPVTHWTPGTGGVVNFTNPAGIPAAGSAISWTGNYYRRVRFDDDEADFERIVEDIKSGAIELVSVV